MNTFYINTATAETTIAIFESEDGDLRLLGEQRWHSEQNEAEKLQPAVNKLLMKNKMTADDIGQLIVCIGPGGFTSTRIGVSAINAWSFAKDIPVAQVSIFDLYKDPEAMLLVTANANEGWLKLTNQEAKFVSKEKQSWPASFSFAGVLHEEWKKYLVQKGGGFVELKEELPNIAALEFTKELIKPWYYKDPNITHSKKLQGIINQNKK